MYYDKKSLTKLAAKISGAMNAEFLLKCLNGMTPKKDALGCLRGEYNYHKGNLQKTLDKNIMMELISQSEHGLSWNVISSQLKANENLLRDVDILIDKVRRDIEESLPKASDNQLSQCRDPKELLEYLFSMVDYNNVRVEDCSGTFYGHNENGLNYAEQTVYFEVDGYEESQSGTFMITYDETTGVLKGVSTEVSEFEIVADHSDAESYIGDTFTGLLKNTDTKAKLFVVIECTLGKDLHHFSHCLEVPSDKVHVARTQLKSSNSKVMVYSVDEMKELFAWNCKNGAPFTKEVGGKLLVHKL